MAHLYSDAWAAGYGMMQEPWMYNNRMLPSLCGRGWATEEPSMPLYKDWLPPPARPEHPTDSPFISPCHSPYSMSSSPDMDVDKPWMSHAGDARSGRFNSAAARRELLGTQAVRGRIPPSFMDDEDMPWEPKGDDRESPRKPMDRTGVAFMPTSPQMRALAALPQDNGDDDEPYMPEEARKEILANNDPTHSHKHGIDLSPEFDYDGTDSEDNGPDEQCHHRRGQRLERGPPGQAIYSRSSRAAWSSTFSPPPQRVSPLYFPPPATQSSASPATQSPAPSYDPSSYPTTPSYASASSCSSCSSCSSRSPSPVYHYPPAPLRYTASRAVQAPTPTPTPTDVRGRTPKKCPYCPYVPPKTRGSDLRRHIETHYAQDAEHVCSGVPLDQAGEHVIDESNERVFEFKGVARQGGCWRVFSRKDALQRHLNNPRNICVSDMIAYKAGEPSDPCEFRSCCPA